jgi:hypothetical protein
MLKLDVNFQFHGSKYSYYLDILLQLCKKISNCYYSDIYLTKKKKNPLILSTFFKMFLN